MQELSHYAHVGFLNSKVSCGKLKYTYFILDTAQMFRFLPRSVKADGTPEVTCAQQGPAGVWPARCSVSLTICELLKIS